MKILIVLLLTVIMSLYPHPSSAEEVIEQRNLPVKYWSMLLIPRSGKKVDDHHWIKAMEKHPDLKLTVAFSPYDLIELTPHKEELLRLVMNGRLEPALRLTGDPPLPIIYNSALSKMYMEHDIPMPSQDIAWPEDAFVRIAGARATFIEFWDEVPRGFVQGGGSINRQITEFLIKQKFYWTIAEFPDAEWPPGNIMNLKGRWGRPFWILNPHPLTNLFYLSPKSLYAMIPCCRSSKNVVKKFKMDFENVETQIPVIVFDETRTKVALIKFLDEYYKDIEENTKENQTQDIPFLLQMILTSQVRPQEETDDETVTFQIWPHSWNWMRGLGDLTGPGLTTWVGDSQKNAAWELLSRTREVINEYKNSGLARIQRLDRAMNEFYLAESGDYFEWFGDLNNNNPSRNVNSITQTQRKRQMLFKATLANVYRHLGKSIPKSLRSFSFRSDKSKDRDSDDSTTSQTSSLGRTLTNVKAYKRSQNGRKRNAKNLVKLSWKNIKVEKGKNDDAPLDSDRETKTIPVIERFTIKVVPSQQGEEMVHFLFTIKSEMDSPAIVDLYIDINNRHGAGKIFCVSFPPVLGSFVCLDIGQSSAK